MISKLRNRLLTTIMGFIGSIMLLAFAAVFVITYTQIYNENLEKVNSKETIEVTSAGQMLLDGQEVSGGVVISRVSPDIGVYFNLIADAQGNRIYTDSALELDETVYSEAAKIGMESPKGGIVELASRRWLYCVSEEVVIHINGAQPQGIRHIRFLDVTESYKTLENLALTLAGLFAVLLVVFYFLARYFANRSIKPMAKAWEIQRQFIADASHELKTPISTLNTNLDVLYQSQDDTIRSQIKWVDNSKKVLSRMTSLIRDMLELARVDELVENPAIECVHVGEMLDDIIDVFTPSAARKHIEVVENIEPDIGLNSNYDLVHQVLDILMDNAVKYTNEYGQIAITARMDKNAAIVQIENSGPGITRVDMDRIFDRFYRGDKSRVYKEASYGLGLSIARSAAQRVDSEIAAESILDRTIFTFRIIGKKIPRM